MTRIKIKKMLESSGSNLITLDRISKDKKAPLEIRLTAALASIDIRDINYKKEARYQVQKDSRNNHSNRKIW